MMNAKLEVDLGYKSKDSHVLVIYSIWDRYISIDGNRKVSAQWIEKQLIRYYHKMN